ncbi:winged helix-turn-helix domain-containing protein [Massilia sp. HP4]|uniref:ATP-binding protein n=1 Tax=Massilia sp. HP4 TaxID=2562316 RepID=UPI00148541F3|nr:winged helix-turn-helix domain-containing protein [Massilia sp. HP4]
MNADEGELLFGPFTLSLAPRALRLGARPVALGVRPLGLLALLAGRAGEVVSKEEIATRVWAGASMEASRLRAHVATLRRALGDGEDGSRYIVNVLGRGYVFVAPVRRMVSCALPAAPGLPAGPEHLLGRDEALACLERLVRERRLVSIVGAGGLGKSALALAVAGRAGAHFPDGVAYLDLAPLSDGASLAGALAAAVGLAAGTSWTALCARMSRRRQLVVLDNCGHLAEAAALLAEALLDAAPQLHLLATSREALCLRAEWIHRLAPLGLPRPALDLFALRYGAAEAARLDPASQARAAQLCRQLDGNPLLIGLAAVRARTVGIAALADCVDALFELDGGAPELGRHRSPDALLDWSCRLLGPNERTVLGRLAVFRRPFTLDQAVQACVCLRLDAGAVVEGILALGARSLVEVELEDGPDGVRYRLSNATRRYAGRRLAPDDAAAPVGARCGESHAVVTSSVERMLA